MRATWICLLLGTVATISSLQSAAAATLDPDRFEVNDSFDQATPLGSSSVSLTNLTIGQVGDLDYYMWQSPGTGQFQIDVLFDDFRPDSDLDVWLFNSEMRKISEAESSDSNEQIVHDTLFGDKFFVRVFGFSSSTNEYDLRILAPNTSTPPPAKPVPPVSTGGGTRGPVSSGRSSTSMGGAGRANGLNVRGAKLNPRAPISLIMETRLTATTTDSGTTFVPQEPSSSGGSAASPSNSSSTNINDAIVDMVANMMDISTSPRVNGNVLRGLGMSRLGVGRGGIPRAPIPEPTCLLLLTLGVWTTMLLGRTMQRP